MDIHKHSSGAPISKGLNGVQAGLILSCIVMLHCLLQYQHLPLDYWNDELYTLQHFVFRSTVEICQDYHVPNNHVFFSLFLHAVVGLLGIHSLQDALANPHMIRSLLLAVSILTILATYRLTVIMGGRTAALLAALMLVTTIPFYNYAVQVRGYTLSMCLYTCLGWCIVHSIRRPTAQSAVVISLIAALCLYTLPSNIYFIVVAAIALVIVWLIYRRSVPTYLPASRMLVILAALVVGVGIAVLFYLPIASQMAGIPSFHAGSHTTGSLTHTMPVVAYHFLSARYLLLLLYPLGLFLSLRGKLTGRRLPIAIVLVSVLVFVVPFILSEIRRDNAPYRIFLTGLPILISGAALIIARCFGLLQNRIARFTMAALLVTYCILVCITQINKTAHQALNDIAKGTRAGDLYFQYNLHYYHPSKDAQEYLAQYRNPQVPLIEACRSDAEILKYLRLSGHYIQDNCTLASALAEYKTIDVLIENPASFYDSLPVADKARWTHRQLLPGPRNVQFIRITDTARIQ